MHIGNNNGKNFSDISLLDKKQKLSSLGPSSKANNDFFVLNKKPEKENFFKSAKKKIAVALPVILAVVFALASNKNDVDKSGNKSIEETSKTEQQKTSENEIILESETSIEKSEELPSKTNGDVKNIEVKPEVEIPAEIKVESNKDALENLTKVLSDCATPSIDFSKPIKDLAILFTRYRMNPEVRQYVGTEDVVDKAIECLKTEEANGKKVLVDDVKRIFKSLIIDDETINNITSIARELESSPDISLKSYTSSPYEFLQIEKNKKIYIENILNKMDEIPQQENETTSEYLKRILVLHKEKVKKQKLEFDESIKAKLEYKEVEKVEPTPLNKAQLEELAEGINGAYQTNKYSAETDFSTLLGLWIKKHISGFPTLISQETEKILMEHIEPHIAKENSFFKYEPLYRWIDIYNTEKFLEKFEDGAEYTYPKIQSCSICKDCGELNGLYRNFSDNSSSHNVKFVIHPKSKISQAKVLGEGKYGSFEAIYTADQKFKVIGKIEREINEEEYDSSSVLKGEKFQPFYRWEIHLQEL